MTTRNAPAPTLLGQVRTGAGAALLGVSALMALYVVPLGLSRLLPPTPAAEVDTSLDWSYVGTGDDTTTAFDVDHAGTYTVEWFGPCGADLTLNEWNGAEIVQRVPLGESADTAATVALTVGTWYGEVRSECRWGVRVSRT